MTSSLPLSNLDAVLSSGTALLAGTTFAAGALRGFSGFGAALLLAPVYSLFMPPVDAVAIIVLLNVVTTAQMLPGAVPITPRRFVGSLFFPAVTTLPVGVAILSFFDPEVMRRFIGAIVVALCLMLLSGWTYNGPRGRLTDVATGMLSGFLTGTAGIGGPPLILYLLAGNTAPSVNRAIFIVFFGMTQVVALLSFALGGLLTAHQAIYAAMLLPVYLLATATGTWAFQTAARRREAAVRQVSLVFLLAIGVVTLFM
ncbi:sulfite exporter TauE/SafE family protein [Ferruginivarius sediminum]|uniref:Probable membrane transporter protein n=1 Tax=Ferruginivarius sediminum TaxID=2661937 RepID=A0A369TBU0_9PROT|nr:sulfite exporter TauE/SafE family protein [Ferruginivarius sediminum]RDD61984.1 sulfite exporter TauE/SafE family protein [Ferruginivarius sediminum]